MDRLETERDFEKLFREYYAPVCRKVLRVIKDSDVTEDLVQEVFVRIWEKRAQIVFNTSASSYIYRAALNAAFNHIKRQHPFVEIEASSTEIKESTVFFSQLEHKEAEDQAARLLEHLPPACKTVFLLCREEGLSYKEIAETLNISIKTVENQMGKALKILREKLTGYIVQILILLQLF